RGAAERTVRPSRRAAHGRREVARDRRALGTAVRPRSAGKRSGEHAVLHRGAERRERRSLRLDHGTLIEGVEAARIDVRAARPKFFYDERGNVVAARSVRALLDELHAGTVAGD